VKRKKNRSPCSLCYFRWSPKESNALYIHDSRSAFLKKESWKWCQNKSCPITD
jgi:hypothetical protein